jgi:hypothetical protein
MGIAALIRIFVAWREVGAWLGLIDEPAVPSPRDWAAEHRPDQRAVPTMFVDEPSRAVVRTGKTFDGAGRS